MAAKLDDIQLPQPKLKPKPELSPWFTRYFDIDHEVIDGRRIVIEYKGRKLLVEGSHIERAPVAGGWWHILLEKVQIRTGVIDEPVEERQKQLAMTANDLRYFRVEDARPTEGEKLISAAPLSQAKEEGE